jgi:hypothetical protein
MMTWEQLAERIASMTPEQRCEPAQPDADRFVLAGLFLEAGEKALEEFHTATGIRYQLDEIEDFDDGKGMAWYVRQP